MKKTLVCLLSLLLFLQMNGQVGIGTTTPNASAALDISDSTRGILIPRMTMVKRKAIPTPAQGLMVFQTDSTMGYWYFDGSQWKSISTQNNGGGKQTLVLTDDITDAEAQVKIAAEAGPNTQEIRIFGCSNLTTVDLSTITSVIQVTITDNPLLQSIDLGNLKSCAGEFLISDCPLATNLTMSSFESSYTSNGIKILSTGFVNLHFPSLKNIAGLLNVINNNKLAVISFPALKKVGKMDVSNNSLLTVFAFNQLTTAAGISVTSNKLLPSFTFPALVTVTTYAFTISSDSALVSISCPALTNGYLTITGNPLLQSVSFPVMMNSGFEISYNQTLTSISFAALVTTNGFVISNNQALTSLLLPALTTLISHIYIYKNQALAAISFPALTTANGALTIYENQTLAIISSPVLMTLNSGLYIYSNPTLSSISLPALQTSRDLNIYNNNALPVISFPALTSNNDIFKLNNLNSLLTISCPLLTTLGTLEIKEDMALTSVSFPQLSTSGDFSVFTNNVLTSFLCPSLTKTLSLVFRQNSAITTLSFPALTEVAGSLEVSNCSNFTSVFIDNLTIFNNVFYFQNNKLPSSQVNYLLHKLVNIPGLTGKSIYLYAQTPSAPPTGQGLVDKATLAANPRGNFVYTD